MLGKHETVLSGHFRIKLYRTISEFTSLQAVWSDKLYIHNAWNKIRTGIPKLDNENTLNARSNGGHIDFKYTGTGFKLAMLMVFHDVFQE